MTTKSGDNMPSACAKEVRLVEAPGTQREKHVLDQTFLTRSKKLCVKLRVITRSFLCCAEIYPNKESIFTLHTTNSCVLGTTFLNKEWPNRSRQRN